MLLREGRRVTALQRAVHNYGRGVSGSNTFSILEKNQQLGGNVRRTFFVSGTAALLLLSAPTAQITSGADTLRGQGHSAIDIAPNAEWRWYYTNHFYSKQTCNNRGYAMTTPGHPGYVYGITAYTCVMRSGESKWSMRVLD